MDLIVVTSFISTPVTISLICLLVFKIATVYDSHIALYFNSYICSNRMCYFLTAEHFPTLSALSSCRNPSEVKYKRLHYSHLKIGSRGLNGCILSKLTRLAADSVETVAPNSV